MLRIENGVHPDMPVAAAQPQTQEFADALAEYGAGDRAYRSRCQRVRALGLLPVLFAITLLIATNLRPAPGLWSVIGIAIGMELVIWGADALHKPGTRRSRLAERLVSHTQSWMPRLLFGIENAFIALAMIILWFTLADIGFPAGLFDHVVFAALLLQMPFRRFLRRRALIAPTMWNHLTDDVSRYVLYSLVALFIASVSTGFILPPGQPLDREPPASVLFLWVPAILVCIAMVVLAASDIARFRQESRMP
jgi:hypothetical protein